MILSLALLSMTSKPRKGLGGMRKAKTIEKPTVSYIFGIASWGHLGAILGSSWGHLGVILGPLGAILAPLGAELSPFICFGTPKMPKITLQMPLLIQDCL